MELAGVLIAVLLLIFLIYKRLSLIPATLICVAVLALTNGFSYMDLFINHYGVLSAARLAKEPGGNRVVPRSCEFYELRPFCRAFQEAGAGDGAFLLSAEQHE